MRASRSGIKRPNKKKLLANLPSSCQPKPRSKPGSAKNKKVVLKVKHRRKRTFAREDSPEGDNGNVRRGKRKRAGPARGDQQIPGWGIGPGRGG